MGVPAPIFVTITVQEQSSREVISYTATSRLTEVKHQVSEEDILGLGWDGVYLWASTSQSVDSKDVDFNMEEYLSGTGDSEDFELEQIAQKRSLLNRFKANNSTNSLFDLSIIDLNIQLSHFCFQSNYIWAADTDNSIIHKIRVVADLP